MYRYMYDLQYTCHKSLDLNMGRPKIDSAVEGVIIYLLKKKMSLNKIQRELKGKGNDVSISTIYRVKHSIDKIRGPDQIKPKPGQFRRTLT